MLYLPPDDSVERALARDVTHDDGTFRPSEISARELREAVLSGDVPQLQSHLFSAKTKQNTQKHEKKIR